MAQIYHAQVMALLLGAAVVGLQHGAVSALAGGQHPQAEARPAQHGPIALHGALQGGAGQQIHLRGLAGLVPQHLPHGIVEEVLVLLLRQIVPELIGQVIQQLLLRHGGHHQLTGEHLRGGQHQRRMGQGMPLLLAVWRRKSAMASMDKILEPETMLSGSSAVTAFFQVRTGEIYQLDAALTDVKANDLFQNARPHFQELQQPQIPVDDLLAAQRRQPSAKGRCWGPTGWPRRRPVFFAGVPTRCR